ncbi:7956_t:CDS:2 [Ambispora gerdemannii]|uniref:7956_t:CDS:1 n=1 Tax=Ambispora gerdemannii TaxID=144530 RepID=A0A9N9FW70_9GLOM|nr:7956_t:CDS:2 [Ambispora gerdemannii]
MPMKQTLVKPRSTLNKSEINSRDANYAMETQNIINVITGNITKSNKSFKSTIIILAQSVISPEIIEPTEEAEQSDSTQRLFSDITSEIWNQFKIIFDRIMAEKSVFFR